MKFTRKSISIIMLTLVIPCQIFGQGKIDQNKGKEGDKLINRKVLILDFVNSRNSPDYSYLENSIPDSFLDPLDRTKSFELLSRNIWQKFVKNRKFKKEEAYQEESAVEAGRLAGADVVVIGSFAALSDKMQIFAKAIELSSGRTMVSRNATAPLDNSMFQVINKLTREMSMQMKDKLPPLSQKVITIEREKYIKIGTNITYGGMVWRTLVIPGLGHAYANEWRGWVYMPLWLGALGTFVYGAIDFAIKEEAYLGAQDGLDAAFTSMNDAMLVRNIAFSSLLGVYVIAIADILIFGKSYEKIASRRQSELNFYAVAVPVFSPATSHRNNNNGTDFYIKFAIEKKI